MSLLLEIPDQVAQAIRLPLEAGFFIAESLFQRILMDAGEHVHRRDFLK